MRALIMAGALVAATASARADNPLVEHAREASRAGKHAQAVADLRRAGRSILTRPSDPTIPALLDRAHAGWLGGIYATRASDEPVVRYAVLGALLAHAGLVGSTTAQADLGAHRDALALELRPLTLVGDLRRQLLTARRLVATAGSSAGRAEIVQAELEGLAARVAGEDADTRYLRDQLRSFYRLAEPPAHPRPVRAAWTFEVAPSACDDVVAEARRRVETATGDDAIRVQVQTTACTPAETRGSQQETMVYWRTEKVPRTVRSYRTERVTGVRQVQRQVCRPTYTETTRTYDRGTSTVTTSYMKSGENCYTESSGEPFEETREVFDEQVVQEEQQVAYREDVAVTTRRSTLTLGVVVTAQSAGSVFQFTTQLAAAHDDRAWTAANAGSRAFDDARATLLTDLGAQLADQLSEFSRASIRTARIATLDAELAVATGSARPPLLRARAVERGAASAELIAAIAEQTTLPAAQVSDALAGLRMDVALAFPAPALELALPDPDAGALADLYVVEERSILARAPSRYGGAVFGLGVLSSESASGFGGTVGLRFSRMPDFFLLRSYRAVGFVEGTAVISSGRGGDAVLGGLANAGLLAGFAVGPISLDAVGVVGIDGLYQFNSDADRPGAPAGDPGVPAAGFVGYGAILGIRGGQRSVTLDLRRHHRLDDVRGEMWLGELRVAKQWWFVGARASIYQDLLDGDAPRGTWLVGAQLGVLWGGQDTRVGDFVSEADHTR